MKLTFIFALFPPETPPTAVMAEDLVRAFVGRGDEVTVVAPFPSRPGGRIYPGHKRRPWRNEQFEGARLLRVLSFSIGAKRMSIFRILENVSFGLASAVALAFSSRPDIVLIETWPILASVLTLAVCRLRGIPAVHYIKDLYPEAMISAGMIRQGSGVGRILLALDRLACRMASRNVVISAGMADHVRLSRHVPASGVVVIPDWIDLHGMRPDGTGAEWRRRVGLAEGDFVALFAGTVGHASGAGILADVAVLLKNDPGIRIVCVGEGPIKPQLEGRKTNEYLTNLILLPFQPREIVASMHSAADVFLLPTAPGMGASSVPSKFITYLAMSRPVVACATPGSDLATVVEAEGVGWVVPPADAVSFAIAIRRAKELGAEPRAEMGTAARRLAVSRHSTESAIERFSMLFREIIPPSLQGVSKAR